MRAVWSFWSKPYGAATGWGWSEPLHHLLAWGLSLRLARRHYPDTVLVTDRAGRSLLVDGLGLSFTQVSTELERLHDADASLWALVGMAAIMGGTMRSPFTAVIFALELTDDIHALPVLFVGAICALGVTVLVMRRSILTEKIARRGRIVPMEYHAWPQAGSPEMGTPT